MAYEHFAFIYDDLMKDVPYHLWMDFLTKQNVNDYKQVLELACGTGTLTLLMAEEGYNVTGTDISEEMLTVAKSKSDAKGINIPYFQQDMTQLSGFEPFEMICIFCDSLNYLTTEAEVQSTFKSVYEMLIPNGLFLFDVHSIHKIKNVFLHQHTFTSNEEEISYIWNCFPGEDEHSVEHDLSFFVKENDFYRRYDEFHIQKTFPIETYETWLKQFGFKVIDIIGDFDTSVNLDDAERILFAAQKIE